MKNINFKIYNGNKISKKFLEKICKFYDKDEKRKKQYKIWIINSTYIIVWINNWKILWAIRVISDNFQNAFLVDLLVSEKSRKNGIWSQLLKNSIKLCLEKNIKNIQLISDPNNPWLKYFYEKNWFLNNQEDFWYYFFYKN